MDITMTEEGQLDLINRQDVGVCKRDCETVRSACEDVINEDMDALEIALFLYENQKELTENKLLEWLCSETCLSDGMRPKVPKKLAKKSKVGKEVWEQMSKEEQQKRTDIFREMMRQNGARKADL